MKLDLLIAVIGTKQIFWAIEYWRMLEKPDKDLIGKMHALESSN